MKGDKVYGIELLERAADAVPYMEGIAALDIAAVHQMIFGF